MNNEIQLISDGDGLAIIGSSTDVEQFLAAERLPSKELDMARLTPILQTGAGVAKAGSEVAANSGRWVQLTKESAKLVDKHGLAKSSNGLSTGVVRAKNGQIKGIVEFAKQSPGTMLSNPAVLAGAAGIMAQVAMQQTMEEITDYLKTIDAKVDDVLRNQKNAVLADMLGVGLVIDEAMTVRDQVGRVSEVTWSKIQATSLTVARTQAYALGQLDALAEKLERKSKIDDLAETAEEAESTVQEWLVVLARCVQLQEASAVLELDRVLDSAPDELDRHRLALKAARQNRLKLISRSTELLVDRIKAAANIANTKVLLHPRDSRAVVNASNHVSIGVGDFHGRLGIESAAHQALEAKRWTEAADEAKDKVVRSGAESVDAAKRFGSEALKTGGEGVDAARRFGTKTIGGAKSATGKLSGGISGRLPRRRGEADDEQH